MNDTPIYAVIMAGGSGTRFWPASRRLRPKQLLPLAGEKTLIRQAVDRVEPLCGIERIYIATGQHLIEPTLAAVPELSRRNLLVEPVARNTAPCIGWAAATIARLDPNAVIMALPSDPYIDDPLRFQQALEQACEAARQGAITTIGIRPTRPETGYGYIEAKDDVPGAGGATINVARFVEKPDLERARAFVASGRFFWNAGMFFFRAKDMLAAIEAHLPQLAAGLVELDQAAARGREQEVLDEVFGSFSSISIDHGVMEHVDNMKMVIGDFGWSDLGSWLAVSDLARKDGDGNSAPAGALLIDSKRCHVVDARDSNPASGAASPSATVAAGPPVKKLIALVGVEDLVVVETDDALLVVKRQAAQQVRDVVDALKARGDSDLV